MAPPPPPRGGARPGPRARAAGAATGIVGVLGAIQTPDCGVLDPEGVPHDLVIDFCRPYLGELAGVYSEWTPLQDRGLLFPEDVDRDDPWQFKNFRVL